MLSNIITEDLSIGIGCYEFTDTFYPKDTVLQGSDSDTNISQSYLPT